MAVASADGMAAVAAERLAEGLARELDRSWRLYRDRMVRAGGEEGRIDLVLVNPRVGVALLGIVEDAEEATPEDAVAAFRTMLAEHGFAARFPGHLPVVALVVAPSDRSDLRTRIEAAFSVLPRIGITEDAWVGRIAALIEAPDREPAASRSAAAPTAPIRLRPPSREEAWQVGAVPEARSLGPALTVEIPPERRDASMIAAGRFTSVWASMGLALAILAGVLLAMAALSRGGLPHW